MTKEIAIFGAGCFWGVEEAFRTLKGVLKTEVGYCGGHTENPAYKEVCTDTTGHAEVVQLEFEPEIISYKKLLEVFWSIHDPTTLNRQGPDYGSQYRSVIFTTTDEQKNIAENYKKELNESARFPRKIITQINTAPIFYSAEEYHQQYLQKKGLKQCH